MSNCEWSALDIIGKVDLSEESCSVNVNGNLLLNKL
jgi:hypothetical protein